MKTLEITYSSGVTIEDSARLAGLVLYYDKIWLPHPYVFDPEAREIASIKPKKIRDLEYEQDHYLKWRKDNRELFEEGVLEVLPDCLPEGEINIQDRVNEELGFPGRDWVTYSELLGGKVTLVLHHIFGNKRGYCFYDAPKKDKEDRLKLEIAHRVLTHDMLLVEGLEVERLLKLREKLEPYRDGFQGYISRLGNAARGQLSSGKSLEEVVQDILAEKNVLEDVAQFQRTRRKETLAAAAGMGAGIVGTVGIGVGLAAGCFASGGALLGALVPAMSGFLLAGGKMSEWLGKKQEDDRSAFAYIASAHAEDVKL